MVKLKDKTIGAISIFVALFFDIKTVNTYLVRGSEEGGIMALLYIATIALLIFTALRIRRINQISKNCLWLGVFLVVIYFLTCITVGTPRVGLSLFCVFTIVSLLLPSIVVFDTRTMLKAAMIISSPAVLFINQIFVFQSYYIDNISMGLSYAYLSPVIFSVTYLFTYFKKESLSQKLVTLLFASINFVFLFNIVAFGTRGPVFAILSLCGFLYITEMNKSGEGFVFNRNKTVITLVSIIFLYIFLVPALSFISSILSSNGINLYFLDKMIHMQEVGDMTNGREELYQFAIDDFVNSPIWGCGLDRFDFNHPDSSYPHNFLLQILTDGGLILFFSIMIPVFVGLKFLLKKCTYDEYVLFAALAFSSIPGALFSGDLWESCNLWFLFGYLISYKDKYINNERTCFNYSSDVWRS